MQHETVFSETYCGERNCEWEKDESVNTPLLFRRMAVERMRDCPSVSALAKELGIDRSNLYEWQRQLEHASESSARVTSPIRELRKQVHDLQRVLAEKTLEVDFFKST